jgi:hypothetical protein
MFVAKPALGVPRRFLQVSVGSGGAGANRWPTIRQQPTGQGLYACDQPRLEFLKRENAGHGKVPAAALLFRDPCEVTSKQSGAKRFLRRKLRVAVKEQKKECLLASEFSASL